MMARASEAFRTISRGAYTGLGTQLDRDNQSLIAFSAAGGSKIAAELSKGARFQLYLAFRVRATGWSITPSAIVPDYELELRLSKSVHLCRGTDLQCNFA